MRRMARSAATAIVTMALAATVRGQTCAPTFPVTTAYPVGPNATAITATDFNRDGRPDLAVASAGASTVSVLLATGTGIFEPAVVTPVVAAPFGIAGASVDGDARPDLLVSNRDGDSVSVLLGNGDGTFSVAPAVVVGDQPLGLATGDFDRDGHADFAVGNAGSDSVSVRLGNGTGGFAGADFPAGASPRYVAVADLDRDGDLDLVVSNFTNGMVSVLLGDGLGAFGGPTSFAASAGALGLGTGDFDRDGRLDVAVTGFPTGGVSILLGDGRGGLAEPLAIPLAGQPRGIAVSRLDADGYLDLAVADASGDAVIVLRGNGDGSFTPGIPVGVGDLPNEVVALDLDADGRPDLAAADQSAATVSVARSAATAFCPRASFPGVHQAFNFASYTTLVATGDFDSDGLADLLILDDAATVRFAKGDGSGQFAPSFASQLSALTMRALQAADLNGDGHLDAVAVHPQENRVTVLRGDGTGHFTRTSYATLGQGAQGLAISDLSGDGVPDVAVTNNSSSNLVVFRGQGDGTLVAAAPISVGGSPEAIVAADLNGDGWMDLAVGDRALAPTRVVVLLGNGLGGFAPPAAFGVDVYPTGIAAADLNGDGAPDLVVADFAGDRLKVYPGNGDGTFGSGVAVPLPGDAYRVAAASLDRDPEPELLVTGIEGQVLIVNGDLSGFVVTSHPVAARALAAVAADFDGNGTADLAVSDFQGTFTVLRGDGNGGFPTAPAMPFAGPPATLAAGDLDRDGRADLLVGHGNQVSVMRGDGLGGFGVAVPTALGFAARRTVLSDLDGDGKQDLLATDPAGGRLAVAFGTGSGGFGSPVTYPTGAGARGIFLADFDGNGWLDVAVTNMSGNTTSILSNDGAGGLLSTADIPGLGGPAGVATGDFDQDGRLDLAVTNQAGSSVALWKGQGDGTFVGTGTLPVSSPPDAIDTEDFNFDGKVDLLVFCDAGQFPVVQFFVGDGTGGFTDSGARVVGVGQLRHALRADLDRDGRLEWLVASGTNNLSIGNAEYRQDFLTGRLPDALVAEDFDRDGRVDVAVGNVGDSTISVLRSTRCEPRRMRVSRNVSSCDAPLAPFAVQPRIELVDDSGNLAMCSTGSVQASLLPSGPAVLLGTTSASVSSGVADFTNLAVDRPVLGSRLQFTSGTFPPTRSRTFTQGLTASIAGPSPVAQGSTPVYDAGSGYDRYRWSVDEGATLSVLPAVALPGLALGGHTVRVDVRRDSCPATATRTVGVVPPPVVTVDDGSIIEGDAGSSTIGFAVHLSAALGQAVSVPFAAVGGSATSGVDFGASQGTLVVAPGATSAEIPVAVIGDPRPEQDETFLVQLGAPQNGTLGDGQASGTIVNDDAPDALAAGRELAHGSRVEERLAAWGSVPDHDWYRIVQAPGSSYEVVLDGGSADIAEPAPDLRRTGADGSVTLQQSVPVGLGAARSLRWRNTSTGTVSDERVSVASTGCQVDCGADDRYRLRAYETTLSAPRFNNTASQVSVVVLQNAGGEAVAGVIEFSDAQGVSIHREHFGLAPHGVLALGTTAVPELAGASGSLTVSHDAPYGVLTGKVVMVEPATGFAFDTPIQSRAH
jgi:hypothetical protein